MVEARYFKDYKYNYLILKCEDTEDEGNYQRKMLSSNKIEKILKCSVRNINGAAYFYYDISSKVTLENLYQGKKMSYEQVKDFLEQMDLIYRNLAQYFMEESGLLIQPEYIYYDISSKQYYGLYYPKTNKKGEITKEPENLYEPLMDFLLNHIDTENQKLVDNIYQIYELSEEQFFSLADALALFEEMETDTYEAEEVIEREIVRDTVREEYNQNQPYQFEEYGKEYNREEGKNNLEKNRIFYGIFAILSVCGLGGEFWIYLEYELSQQEFMMIVCCAVVTFLCFLFSIAQCILSGRRRNKQEQEDILLQQEIEDEFRDVRPVDLQTVLDKNMDREVVGKCTTKLISEVDDNFGETVFIDLKNQKGENKLYALDRKNKKHIELTEFPFTIGKMAGCVDCVLSDNSISRMHARIEKRENKIFLTDMNSTNGTYKNGLRLDPNTTVELEPGDEIRFGKLNYCYR